MRDKEEKDNRRRGKRVINEGFLRYRDRKGEKKKRGVRVKGERDRRSRWKMTVG